MENVNDMFIPEVLRRERVWMLWKKETKDGRQTKMPYSVYTWKHGSSTNERDWCHLEQAMKALTMYRENFSGLGLVITKRMRLVFIDLDHCFEDGKYTEQAMEIMKRFKGSYMERSQSGTGVHILVFGTIPKSVHNQDENVEIYDSGRYMAMTGETINECEIEERQEALDWLYEKYHKESIPKTRAQCSRQEVSLIGDQDLIDLARKASNGQKFVDLYEGQWEHLYNSQSEADMALCSILAFWCNRDTNQMDRLFRSSGLYREKWDREDYRNGTLLRAVNVTRETYTESLNNRMRKEVEKFARDFGIYD